MALPPTLHKKFIASNKYYKLKHFQTGNLKLSGYSHGLAWYLAPLWFHEFQPKEACLEGHVCLLLFHVVT